MEMRLVGLCPSKAGCRTHHIRHISCWFALQAVFVSQLYKRQCWEERRVVNQSWQTRKRGIWVLRSEQGRNT